jgi:hypothetical protein
MTNRSRLFLLVATIFTSAFVYLIGNGSVALWDRDEPRYAQTSRQMLQTGDWVVPHYLDNVRTAKPALIYWCQAIAMRVFGDNEFAARFPSAMAIIGGYVETAWCRANRVDSFHLCHQRTHHRGCQDVHHRCGLAAVGDDRAALPLRHL